MRRTNASGHAVAVVEGRKFLAVALVIFILGSLLGLQGGAAQEGATRFPGGGFVRANHPDASMPYGSLPLASICYIDLTSNGYYHPEDPVVLTFQGSCQGNSDSGDIRLSKEGDRDPGQRLGSSPSRGLPLNGLSPEPKFYYFDEDSSNHLSPGDSVYLRMHNSDNNRANVGDVRITPYGNQSAGNKVLSGDPDNSRGLAELGNALQQLRHVDLLNTNSVRSIDYIYLTADSTRDRAGLGDLRIYSPDPQLPYGGFLTAGASDATDFVRSIERTVCHVDREGTGTYSPGDALYISIRTQCSGTVQEGDIRIATTSDGSAGFRVQSDDSDFLRQFISRPEVRLGFIDMDGNGQRSQGDLYVLNIVNPDLNTALAGDVLMTPTHRGAGVSLRDGDVLIDTTLQDLGPFKDVIVFKPSGATTTFTANDPVYLSPGTSTGQALKPYDVRVVINGDHPFGGPVALETGELVPELTRSNFSVCSTNSIPGDYIPGDPVYLAVETDCPASVQAGLLRLVPVEDQQAFSKVQNGDPDTGRAILAPTPSPVLRFLSIGQTDWSNNSVVYLHLISPSENRVRVGDIRLTAYNELQAGRAVRGQDIDSATSNLNTLGSLDSYAGYIDIGRTGVYNQHDPIYITPNLVMDHVTVMMLRLTSLPNPFIAPDVPDTPVNSDSGPDSTSAETDSESVEESPTDTDDDSQVDTPGPTIVLLLAIVFVVACCARKIR